MSDAERVLPGSLLRFERPAGWLDGERAAAVLWSHPWAGSNEEADIIDSIMDSSRAALVMAAPRARGQLGPGPAELPAGLDVP